MGLVACAQNTPKALGEATLVGASRRVEIARVPDGGLQPQVVVSDGIVHLIYFKGDPKAGDIHYVRSTDNGSTWTRPLGVNSDKFSAVAMGTIRGAKLSVGRKGRVFVVWNGSAQAAPRNGAAPASMQKYGAAPLLFARLNAAGDAFETQRNLMTKTFNLDGGASVAADGEGRVYVVWHANQGRDEDEATRRVFLAKSTNDGATFAPEEPVWNQPTGACGCCQVGVQAGNGGRVALLFRSATEMVHRDSYFLQSSDGAKTFRGQNVSQWNINACPMSSFSIAEAGKTKVIGWENGAKVYFSRLNTAGRTTQIIEAPGVGTNRKHPVLAVGPDESVLLTWTEGTAWNRGGSLRFQLFDAKNQPQGATFERNGVPTWSFATAFARPDGNFTVLY